MHHNWAKAWEPSWFELWLSCCSMIPRSPRSKRTRRRATCERSDATRKGALKARYRNHPRWSSRVHGSNTPGIRANTQCCLTLPSRGTSKGWRSGRPSCQTLNIMREAVIADIDSTIRGSWRHRAPSRTDVAGRTFVRLRSGWRPEATQ